MGRVSRGVFRVSVITRSTWASLSRRGVPGRGSSTNPSSRFCTKCPTPTCDRLPRNPGFQSRSPNSFGPLAHANTIWRARTAPAWFARAHRSSVVRFPIGFIVHANRSGVLAWPCALRVPRRTSGTAHSFQNIRFGNSRTGSVRKFRTDENQNRTNKRERARTDNRSAIAPTSVSAIAPARARTDT